MTPTPDPATPTPAPASSPSEPQEMVSVPAADLLLIQRTMSRLPVMTLSDEAYDEYRAARDAVTSALAQPQPAAAAPADGGLRAGVEALLEYARNAEAARLAQADAHLTTHPRAAMYDGTAAVVHQLYADKLTAILATTPAPQAQAEAGAEADTWQAVHAVAQEANHLPPGTGGPANLCPDEANARYDLINSAREYRDALKRADDLPDLRTAYHRDLAAFRALVPAAPADAQAQAEAGGEGAGRGEGQP